MRKSLLLVALLAGCGGQDIIAKPEPGQRPARPGESVSLAAPLSAALGCPAAQFTWTALDGGAVTASGVYSAPGCGQAVFPATFHVQADGCGKTATVEVPVQEAVESVRICPGSIAVAPGATVQFYAQVTYSCPGHVEITPPGGTCP